MQNSLDISELLAKLFHVFDDVIIVLFLFKLLQVYNLLDTSRLLAKLQNLFNVNLNCFYIIYFIYIKQLQNLLDTSGLLAKLPHVFDDVVWRDFQGHHRLFVQGANDEDANLVCYVIINKMLSLSWFIGGSPKILES